MRRELEAPRGFGPAVLVGILAVAVGALTPTARADESGSPWHAPESIAAAARAAVTGAGTIETVTVDERLKLKRCAAPLTAELTRPIQRGNGMVAVSCAGPTAWRLFVPVRASHPVPVLVTARALQPGDVIAEADLTIEQRPSAALPYDYLGDRTQAVGLAVRRTQPAGTVLAQGALEHPQVVERGALVTLVSTSGTVTVKSEGVALEPGRLQQRVRVRSASGRVVEGTAEGPGQVRVGP